MIGILSYGIYIPMWRIDREEIAKAAGTASMRGERAVASWDEDSLTMAVEAGLDCLMGIDSREIDGLYFATVSSPFKEKQASSIIASALDLKKDIYACDITTSIRAGTTAIRAAVDAIKAGSARKILVLAADCRMGMPRSEFEQIYGDAAVALLIGQGDFIASIESFSTLLNPIPGPWRREEDTFSKYFDIKLDRLCGLLKDVPEAVNKLLKESNIEVEDISKFALYAPDSRSYMELARLLKIDVKTQLEDPLFATVGITGTPHCLLLLISALEKAKKGERIVCASHGEGSDTLLFRATEEIEHIKGKNRGTGYISTKRMLPSYGRFADFKRTREIGWPAEKVRGSVVKYWRDEKWELPFYGMRCNKCGTLQYPIGRCCIICGEKDDHEEVKLARKGKVFSYTHDYLLGPGLVSSDGEYPCTRVVVDLDDGCRLWLEMSDNEIAEVDIGMPVDLTFRLIHEKGDFRYYAWRARPAR